MRSHVAVLGGGHGVAVVLRALRDHEVDLSVIVTVADDGGSSGELRRRWGGPAVGDMRRSLVSIAGEDGIAARALAAPVTIARFGEHPLGNLLLRSLTKAFGDLEAASEWLSGELRLPARVLPATVEPVSLVAAVGEELIRGESTIGAAPGSISRLSFDPERPEVPLSVIDAISKADWVFLAPGSLFTSVLAVTALPDLSSALARARAHVVWICNLEPEHPETTAMSAADHLAALRSHRVRVDAVLYDPAATLRFAPEELAGESLSVLPRPLASPRPGRHEPALLSAALEELLVGQLVYHQGCDHRPPGERFFATRRAGGT